ncbi:cupin domain-containing protein [Haloferax sp. DFSO52]|uniref:cupin domain-containing protein n=1 Tax=Haloferax sp. DFSO52 TaxID=3388505 RepID=UPI003A8B23F6
MAAEPMEQHANLSTLEPAFEAEGIAIREVEWGEMHVDIESFETAFDTTPLMKGLPDDRCQCPHWGYILEGRMTVNYADHEETVEAGEAYHLAPGHLVSMEAGTELVEFSPKDEFKKTMDVVAKNIEASA